ncbi:MAG: CvpA family protein [Limisphaerales bacterium]|jgi:uncharacterized membrane protein required for colicin V production
MLIWLLTVFLFALFAALGYFKGAIRMVIPLLGLFVAMWLAVPLAPMFKPLVPKLGMENPLWSHLVPPVMAFFLVELVFVVLGFVAHIKVAKYYQYRADDMQRMLWERLNQRVGVSMGLLAGAVYSVLLGVVVYVLGYMTVQITPDGEEGAVRYLNQARKDLQSSGLDRFAAAFDFAPDSYYEAADIMGLLYHNPALHTRLAAYPPFISLSESPEFAEFASDTDFLSMLATQPNFETVLGNPRIQSIIGSQALIDRLMSIDLEDLEGFLHTGVSEKFQDPPMLGRWEVDPYLTFLMEKKRNLDMTAADVRLLRYEMEFMRGLKLYVMPDKRVKLKGPDITQMVGRLGDIEKAVRTGRRSKPPVIYIDAGATSAPAGGGGGVTGRPAESDRLMQERYGVNAGARRPQTQQPVMQVQPVIPRTEEIPPPPTIDELAAQIAQLDVVTLGEGTWDEVDGRLVVDIKPKHEMDQFLVTRRTTGGVFSSVREERLYLTDRKQTIVMAPF